jgi:hypothetical protein
VDPILPQHHQLAIEIVGRIAILQSHLWLRLNAGTNDIGYQHIQSTGSYIKIFLQMPSQRT